ncbi:MAG: UbiA family prenyltransferase [Candidatus Eisenbacteria bacterium]|nr:UbiA family prenyltransferase [Candidatus Eisenbacteria bacterium]
MPTEPAPIWSLRFARAYLVTMRPYLLFVSGAAGLVGLSFGAGVETWRALVAFVALFFSYGLGQALTDCFQTDTDSLSAPYRPLVAGVVARRHVFTASLVGLCVVVLALVALSARILVPGALAVLGLLTYTFFKRRWWGGPPWNAWIVALIPVMGRLVDRGWSPAGLARPAGASDAAFLLAVLAVFFGYANFVVMGYFKDVSADGATGYRTFPVAFGWRAAAVYGDVTAAAAVALAGAALVVLGAGLVSAAALVAAAALYAVAQVAMHRTRDERATGTPIAHGVRALVLVCSSIVLANEPRWALALAVFYAFFELALGLRPERGQV